VVTPKVALGLNCNNERKKSDTLHAHLGPLPFLHVSLHVREL